MTRDFKIIMGIRLVQPPHELDLHNFYDFQEVRYAPTPRIMSLLWHRSPRDGVPLSLPSSVLIEFREVSEFRFLPRDAELPFTEDDCVRDFGYWTDEKWSNGSVMMLDENVPDGDFNAIHFMSGAIIVVHAKSAHATIQ